MGVPASAAGAEVHVDPHDPRVAMLDLDVTREGLADLRASAEDANVNGAVDLVHLYILLPKLFEHHRS